MFASFENSLLRLFFKMLFKNRLTNIFLNYLPLPCVNGLLTMSVIMTIQIYFFNFPDLMKQVLFIVHVLQIKKMMSEEIQLPDPSNRAGEQRYCRLG